MLWEWKLSIKHHVQFSLAECPLLAKLLSILSAKQKFLQNRDSFLKLLPFSDQKGILYIIHIQQVVVERIKDLPEIPLSTAFLNDCLTHTMFTQHTHVVFLIWCSTHPSRPITSWLTSATLQSAMIIFLWTLQSFVCSPRYFRPVSLPGKWGILQLRSLGQVVLLSSGWNPQFSLWDARFHPFSGHCPPL